MQNFKSIVFSWKYVVKLVVVERRNARKINFYQ